MTNIVEKKKVTEVREVEVEKVVLTLDLEQAQVITALVQNLDIYTLDNEGLRELRNALSDMVGDQKWLFDVGTNALGYLRVKRA